jgi:putative hydrolase of the HAD superfamily
MAVIFDGDDTLWSTEELYDDARSRARAIVAGAGMDGALWEELERRIDVDNVRCLGYSMQRFPTSCVEAYGELCRRNDLVPDPIVSANVREAARSVFERSPALLPGAHETLSQLQTLGVRLALLTKGDPVVQCRRVEQSGLSHFFDVIEIVSEKSAEAILKTVASLGVERSDAWVVGNSIRSDILPALEAGLRAIWIDSHVWEHERTHDHLVEDDVIRASQVSEIPAIIER